MDEKVILDQLKEAENGKILVADLLASGDPEESTGLIDSMSRGNLIRVLRDKDLKRLVVRATNKVEFDLSDKPCASSEQVEAFRKAAFEMPNAFVVNFTNHRRYSFRVVKLAGKNFADVFTPDGKQAGFIKYLTSTLHPWFDEIGANHKVLQFTTIAEGKNIIDPESMLSYWVNKDFYGEAFAELHKSDGFQMKSMNGLVKLVINRMYPQEKNESGEKIRRPSLRIRVNALGIAEYNKKEFDRTIEFGKVVLDVHKDAATDENPYPTLTVTRDGNEVAEAFFRAFRNSPNFFESQVQIKDAGDIDTAAIIKDVTAIMDEESKVELNKPFASL